MLIYQALGFPTPVFGHVSLILAPDKSKLSKRHGATSVGEFREDGFLAQVGWRAGCACWGVRICCLLPGELLPGGRASCRAGLGLEGVGAALH